MNWPKHLKVQGKKTPESNTGSETWTECKWIYRRNNWPWEHRHWLHLRGICSQSKGELTDLKRENDCDKRDEDIPEEGM